MLRQVLLHRLEIHCPLCQGSMDPDTRKFNAQSAILDVMLGADLCYAICPSCYGEVGQRQKNDPEWRKQWDEFTGEKR